eukprot:Hpha_TRINITY_DN28626_c0_g1::TRINITY_DN28626_c0_g1_i1::g.156407::m.156407
MGDAKAALAAVTGAYRAAGGADGGAAAGGASATAALEDEFAAGTAALTGKAAVQAAPVRNVLFGGPHGAVEQIRKWKGSKEHDWRTYRGEVPQQEGGGFFCGLFQSHVKRTLHDDRDMVYCLTTNTSGRPHLRFEWDIELHHRIMATIWRKVHGAPQHTPVAPGGDHWEALGFQQANPMTDMGRNGGLYIALLMLWFVEHAPRMAIAAWRESRGGTRSFHWGMRCIACAVLVLEAFEKGKLNKLMNQRDDVWKTLGDFFVGVYARAQERWCAKLTASEMEDWRPIRDELKHWSQGRPQEVMKLALRAMAESRDQKHPDTVVRAEGELAFGMTDLEEVERRARAEGQ